MILSHDISNISPGDGDGEVAPRIDVKIILDTSLVMTKKARWK